MLTSMPLPSRATAAAKYSSASSRKTFGNANRSNASAFNNRNLAAARNASRKSRGQLVVSNGLFGLGLPEIVVIGGVTALLFGPSKLPELGKSLGKTVKSFQSAANEFNEELKKEVDEGNKDGEETKKEEE
jgi:sec-independent protein translocase protein TatA|tara:strand:- start:1612 stop:2004 length:393 start_codon:yes stop_codon:yes gene_type:complete